MTEERAESVNWPATGTSWRQYQRDIQHLPKRRANGRLENILNRLRTGTREDKASAREELVLSFQKSIFRALNKFEPSEERREELLQEVNLFLIQQADLFIQQNGTDFRTLYYDVYRFLRVKVEGTRDMGLDGLEDILQEESEVCTDPGASHSTIRKRTPEQIYSESPEVIAVRAETKARLQICVNALPEAERSVMMARYQIDEGENVMRRDLDLDGPMTVLETSKLIGRSTKRVQQIQADAIAHLRQVLKKNNTVAVHRQKQQLLRWRYSVVRKVLKQGEQFSSLDIKLILNDIGLGQCEFLNLLLQLVKENIAHPRYRICSGRAGSYTISLYPRAMVLELFRRLLAGEETPGPPSLR